MPSTCVALAIASQPISAARSAAVVSVVKKGLPVPPPAIVNGLNTEITRILQLPEVRERLAVLSLEFTPNTPAAFAATLRDEVAKYAKMVKQSGARVD